MMRNISQYLYKLGNSAKTQLMGYRLPQKPAKILSGKDIAKEILLKLKDDIEEIRKNHPKFKPGLAIIQVGGNPTASNIHIRRQLRAAKSVGIAAKHFNLPSTTSENELKAKIAELNENKKINGIIIEMPLESKTKIEATEIVDEIALEKDVDGMHSINKGKICIGNLNQSFLPCTPRACIELINRTDAKIDGSKAVVIGRSQILGTPASELLKWENATVTVCHTHTKNLKGEIRQADIVLAGIGSPEFIRGDWIKPGAVVIDCGINVVKDSTSVTGNRLVGDVCFPEAKRVASYITPVPGGVGPMTIAMLMINTTEALLRSKDIQYKLGSDLTPLQKCSEKNGKKKSVLIFAKF